MSLKFKNLLKYASGFFKVVFDLYDEHCTLYTVRGSSLVAQYLDFFQALASTGGAHQRNNQRKCTQQSTIYTCSDT